MEQDSHIDILNSGKYIVGETSYLEGYSGLNREPVYVTSQGCLLKIWLKILATLLSNLKLSYKARFKVEDVRLRLGVDDSRLDLVAARLVTGLVIIYFSSVNLWLLNCVYVTTDCGIDFARDDVFKIGAVLCVVGNCCTICRSRWRLGTSWRGAAQVWWFSEGKCIDKQAVLFTSISHSITFRYSRPVRAPGL